MKSSALQWFARHLKQTLKLTEECVACHQFAQQPLCNVCLDDIRAHALSFDTPDLLNVPKIADHIETSHIDRLVVATDYVYPMTMMISGLKFRQQLYQVRALQQIISRYLVPHISGDIQVLIPVPLSPERLASRHFNQAYQLAGVISDVTQIPIESEQVRKVKHIPAQTTLSGKARRHNSQGAYCATHLRGLTRVAVIDDVITTGSTANAVSRALKAVNPDLRVEVYCMCISLLHQ